MLKRLTIAAAVFGLLPVTQACTQGPAEAEAPAAPIAVWPVLQPEPVDGLDMRPVGITKGMALNEARERLAGFEQFQSEPDARMLGYRRQWMGGHHYVHLQNKAGKVTEVFELWIDP